jgi:hypothetical protein
MTEQRILQLDAGRASVHLWTRGKLENEANFPVDAKGAADFAAHVGARPNSHYAVLANVGEEGFQYDTIPWVRGRARAALIQRKLAQAYHGSPLTLALSLGREKSAKGRRDERMLFLGLTKPDFIAPWLTALRKAQATVSGVYSTALLSTVLVRRHLHEQAPRFILVTLGRAGIRLCYFEDGKLRFSHLGAAVGADAVAEDGMDAMAASSCFQEANRLLTYLYGQRLVPRDTVLPCLILVHPAQREVFASRCVSTPEMDFRFLDLPAVSRGAGLLTPPANSNADPLFLHLAASQAPAEQFAPENERHLHRLWTAQRWYTAAAAAFLGTCLLVAGAKSWLTYSANATTDVLRKESRALSKAYRARLDALPPLATLPDNLRMLAAGYRTLESHSALPDDSFLMLSRALDAFPAVTLQKLEWAISPNEDGSEAKKTPNAAPGTDFFVVATISAVLPADTGLRQQMAVSDTFLAAIGRDPALRVVLVKRPLTIDPGKFLKSADDKADKTVPPEFSLRISRHL